MNYNKISITRRKLANLLSLPGQSDANQPIEIHRMRFVEDNKRLAMHAMQKLLDLDANIVAVKEDIEHVCQH